MISPSTPGAVLSGSADQAVPLYVRGHSYNVSPGIRCTAGYEFFNQMKARGRVMAATTYAYGGTRLVEWANALIGGAFSGIPSSALWPSAGQPGVHIFDCLLNDYINTSVPQNDTNPSTPSAKQITGMANSLYACLAVMSSTTRYEEPSSGTNWTRYAAGAGNNASGGYLLGTTTPGASIAINVTVPASGQMWALCAAVDPVIGAGGNIAWSIGGTTYATLNTSTITQYGQVNAAQANGPSGAYISTPMALPLTGLPSGAQTITVTKTDATAGVIYVDAILAANPNPPLILVALDPAPPGINYYGTAPGLTLPQSAIVTANKPLIDPAIESVCAQFPNVVIVDNSAIPLKQPGGGLSYADGLHPNDRGMLELAENYELAMYQYLAANASDGAYATL